MPSSLADPNTTPAGCGMVQLVMVSKPRHRPQRPPSSDSCQRTISDFTSLRQDVRATAERVHAGV
jgi:hypothetical protein